MTRRRRRTAASLAARTLVLAAVGLVVAAGPAAADPPAPGDYSSEVTSVDPPVDGVEVEVVGGDSFLVLRVAQGTEVVVLGYDDEPYLRVRPDGTVEQNTNSRATYLNDDRYAEATVPAHIVDGDPADLDPEWEQVGTGGRHAWHDHRIHWMAPNAPPAVARGSSFDWNGTVPLLVDGDRVEVAGTIHYRPDVATPAWIAGGVVAAGAATLVLRRRPRLAAPVAAAVALGAVWVAWGTWTIAPAGSGASPLPVIAAVLAAVAGLGALLAPERHRPIALLAVAAILGSWGVLRFPVLTHPVLPTDVPFAADRAVTTAAIALALAVAVAALSTLPSPTGETAAAA